MLCLELGRLATRPARGLRDCTPAPPPALYRPEFIRLDLGHAPGVLLASPGAQAASGDARRVPQDAIKGEVECGVLRLRLLLRSHIPSHARNAELPLDPPTSLRRQARQRARSAARSVAHNDRRRRPSGSLLPGVAPRRCAPRTDRRVRCCPLAATDHAGSPSLLEAHGGRPKEARPAAAAQAKVRPPARGRRRAGHQRPLRSW